MIPDESEASGSHQELSPEQNEKIAHGQSSTDSPSMRLLIYYISATHPSMARRESHPTDLLRPLFTPLNAGA